MKREEIMPNEDDLKQEYSFTINPGELLESANNSNEQENKE